MNIYMYYIQINVMGQGKASKRILETEEIKMLVTDENEIINRDFEFMKAVIIKSKRCPNKIRYDREFKEEIERFKIADYKLLYQVNGRKTYKDNENLERCDSSNKEEIPGSDKNETGGDPQRGRSIPIEGNVQTFFGRRVPILKNKILNCCAISGTKYS